jgi:hypothetical protein
MKTVTVNGTPITIYDDRPVGISLSGGADSAILLYVLMTHIEQPLSIYTMFAPERRDAMEVHVDMIVDTCAKLTGKTNYTYHKDFVHRQSPEMLFNLMTSKLDSQEVDILYAGLTKFPPYSVWKDFPGQQPDWHNKFRSDEVDRPLYGVSIPIDENTDQTLITVDTLPTNKKEISVDTRVYVPFANLNKKNIAGIYKELGVEKSLFIKTRSCETEDHYPGHCGKCWWCHERLWAFGYLE